MSLELGAIIAIAMAITATVSDYLRIPQKLKGWFSLGLIIILHVGNEFLFNTAGFDWRQTLLQAITAGLASVGIYSTSKNSWEQWQIFRNGNNKETDQAPTTSTPPDNIPYV